MQASKPHPIFLKESNPLIHLHNANPSHPHSSKQADLKDSLLLTKNNWEKIERDHSRKCETTGNNVKELGYAFRDERPYI